MSNFEDIATDNLTLLESLETSTDRVDIFTHPEIEPIGRTGFDREKLAPKPTYIEAGIEKLTALASALEMSDKIPQMVEIFRTMAASWGDRQIGEHAGWESYLSDDLSPFEFSIAFKQNRAELRILLEAQGNEPNLQSNWQAGLQLNQDLAARYHVSLDRFKQIEDLYVPKVADAKFAIWHAVCFYPDKEPEFKLYLNPQAQKKNLAAAVVEESLVRLGFPNVWSNLVKIAAQRGSDKDKFPYFSLDLAANAQARVKVYLHHYDATTEDIEQVLSLDRNYVTGDATEFCQTLTQVQGSFNSKPIVSCFSFVEGNDDRPAGGTLYIPIAYYASDDRSIADRLQQYFDRYNLSTLHYDKSLESFAVRTLDSGVGMHSHLALKREHQHRQVTVYLNPEIHTVRQIDSNLNQGVQSPSQSIEQIAWNYENNSIADHPFLQRLQREPANLTHLWLLFANGREGIVSHFTRRLASVVGRIDNEYIRCILTKQLNEELGNGDISHVHRKLFDRLILALDPNQPTSVSEAMLAPGRELSQRLELLYSDPNPYVGVGAAIVMEIRGKQIDEVMGKEFLTRTNLDRSSLLWLHLHEELEIGHANEALDLANSIVNSDGDKDAALKGAEMTAKALWNFFNGMYRVCFS